MRCQRPPSLKHRNIAEEAAKRSPRWLDVASLKSGIYIRDRRSIGFFGRQCDIRRSAPARRRPLKIRLPLSHIFDYLPQSWCQSWSFDDKRFEIGNLCPDRFRCRACDH